MLARSLSRFEFPRQHLNNLQGTALAQIRGQRAAAARLLNQDDRWAVTPDQVSARRAQLAVRNLATPLIVKDIAVGSNVPTCATL